MNFLGDWGKDIGLLIAGWSRYGSEEAFEADPLRHLLDAYTRIHGLLIEERDAAKRVRQNQGDDSTAVCHDIEAEKDDYFKRLEAGDPDILALWERFRKVCELKYVELYARLGIKFDKYSGESQVSKESIEEVETILNEKGFYKENNDERMIEFSKLGERGFADVKARSADGTTTYLLRDIAAAFQRSKE